MEFVQRAKRQVFRHAGHAGLAVLAASVLALALLPTELAWWPIRIAGSLALILAATALLLQPSPGYPVLHRLLGSLAIVAVSAHVLLVAAIEPEFWRWLTPAIPIEILLGIVAALGLFATLAVRRSQSLRSGVGPSAALSLHRIAGFAVCLAAAAHVVLIAGASSAVILLILAGMALIVATAITHERRLLPLIAIPVILSGLAGLTAGPLSETRLASLRSLPVDHAHFSHADHTGFVCTTCHHNFTDRTGMENCINCHKRLSTSEAMRVDRLFHAFCSDCHRREKEAGRKSGPIDHCAACHDG
jgi:hypothetical protein